MVSLVLAALSGLVWGIGDFAGGKATQTALALPVAFSSKLICLPLVGCYLLLVPGQPSTASIGWGAVAGICGMLGMVPFYRALSSGAMSVVAPLTAVTSAVIPVVVGLVRGERPAALQLLGVGCALVAILLVSLAPSPPGRRITGSRGVVGQALGAGVGFAAFFVFIAYAGRVGAAPAGMWPVLGSQLAAVALGGLLLLLSRPVVWPGRPAWRWIPLAGPFDMSANALYLAATRHGDLALVAPLSALYPVTTVLLAVAVDHERPRILQLIGIGLAVLALLLVAS